jgi:hypothetical protein
VIILSLLTMSDNPLITNPTLREIPFVPLPNIPLRPSGPATFVYFQSVKQQYRGTLSAQKALIEDIQQLNDIIIKEIKVRAEEDAQEKVMAKYTKWLNGIGTRRSALEEREKVLKGLLEGIVAGLSVREKDEWLVRGD